MKAKVLAIGALMFGLSAVSAKTVDGNGNVITKEISVQSYDKIELSGNINNRGNTFGKRESPRFNYTQGKDSPLKVTIDENLFPLLVIESKGNTLSIRVEKNTQIKPTQYLIEGGSEELKELSTSGPMDFRVQGSFKGDNLGIRVSGSSDVTFARSAQVRSGDISVSGSGDITFDALNCDELTCKVSGSGDINLKGKADQARFSVSGSGDIEAFGFSAKNLDCSVSGSGDADVYATGEMSLSVSGSGEIEYKGPATVHQSKSGSGSIHKAN